MATIIPGMEIEMAPNFVEYRSKSGLGTRIVRVFCDIPHDPRIVAQTISVRGSRLEIQPMTLALSDTLYYVNDALRRTGHEELSVSALATLTNP